MLKNVHLADSETGEALSRTETFDVPAKGARLASRQVERSPNHHWQPGAGVMIQNAALPKRSMIVLLCLIDHLRDGNNITIQHRDIARELGLYSPGVTTATSQLVEAGLLLRCYRDRHGVHYRMNPEICWAGPKKDHEQAIEAFRRDQPAVDKVSDVRNLRGRPAKTG